MSDTKLASDRVPERRREAGHSDVVIVRDMQNLPHGIRDANPDVIDMENRDRDVLEQMFQVSCCVVRDAHRACVVARERSACGRDALHTPAPSRCAARAKP